MLSKKSPIKYNIFIFLIKFYQKYLSILFGYGCCRYYPTCSEYALMNFKHNNIFVASFKTIIRILKCNPIFDSGFDYPIVNHKQKSILNTYKRNKKIIFFLVPINDNISGNKRNKFYIIKGI